MDLAAHVFDPDGEVVIIQQCPAHPFAPWRDYEETSTDETSTDEASAEETSVGEAPIAETSAEEIPVKELPVKEEPMETQYFRLQVSARHLILASPVFKAALSENWKKRADPLKNGAVEITTSGWDLEALVILMTILHARSQDLPQEISLELLAKLAVLADYYQCQPFVQYFAEKWINALKVNFPTRYSRDSILWIWVSWAFNQSTEFTKSTSIAISQSSGIITSLGLPIPGSIIDIMNGRRKNAISSIISRLIKLRDDFLDQKRGCSFECSSIMFGALTKEMRKNALLSPQARVPFTGLNFNGLVETVHSFKSPRWGSDVSRYGSGPHHCAASSFSSLAIIQEEKITGPNLDTMMLQPVPKICKRHTDQWGSSIRGPLGKLDSPERLERIEIFRKEGRCPDCRGKIL